MVATCGTVTRCAAHVPLFPLICNDSIVAHGTVVSLSNNENRYEAILGLEVQEMLEILFKKGILLPILFPIFLYYFYVIHSTQHDFFTMNEFLMN